MTSLASLTVLGRTQTDRASVSAHQALAVLLLTYASGRNDYTTDLRRFNRIVEYAGQAIRARIEAAGFSRRRYWFADSALFQILMRTTAICALLVTPPEAVSCRDPQFSRRSCSKEGRL